jgi:hypothetical protein
MRRLLVVAAVGLVVAAPTGRGASSDPFSLAAGGLRAAVARGSVTSGDAEHYRAILADARRELPTLPRASARELRAVVTDVAAQRRGYSAPRALALFGTIEANIDFLRDHPFPAPRTDVLGPDGVIYRAFPGHGLVFHPLANFSRLNTYAGAEDATATARLAQALLARAVPRGHGIVWEYGFGFGRGTPPWTSGMVQAVAAQALARAGDLLSDPTILDAADAAYAALDGQLVRTVETGPWVDLYSFDTTPVLNAQLQAAISLQDYGAIAGDAEASSLGDRLAVAGGALLHRFDTGYWSLYSLGGEEATLHYHRYVVSLLARLAARTGDPRWRAAADRFAAYESQPPIVQPRSRPATVYPFPADGYRDAAAVRFWLSKVSEVTLRVGPFRWRGELSHGVHEILWYPRGSRPGLYRPRLTAVGPGGTRATAVLAPVRVARGRTPRVRLALPPGRGHATLVVASSARQQRAVSLGSMPR